MNMILCEYSSNAAIRAIEENLSAYFPEFRRLPGAEVYIGADLSWAITDVPYPLYNSILDARLAADEADAAIIAAIGRGRARRVPLLWWTGPATRPADLGERLAAHGFVPVGAAPGMAVALDVLEEIPSAPGDFTIMRVDSAEVLAKWCDLASICFDLPDFAAAAWRRWYMAVGVTGNRGLTHYLGWRDSEPVAMGSLFLGAGAAGIYNVGTVPSARRRGIGAAMTLVPLREARALGYRVGVLQSSAMGVGVYRSLGFREFCKLQHYLWNHEGT